VTPARVSNSDVLLTGIVQLRMLRRASHGPHGKSGRYRYYACASHRLKGSAACSNPVAIRESQLDDTGSHGPWGQLITPERLPVLSSKRASTNA